MKVNDENVSYQPYRVYGVFSVVAMGLVMLGCVLIGYCLSTKQYVAVFAIIPLSMIGGFLSKFMYDASRTVVLLTCDGIQVDDAYRKKHIDFFWEDNINIYSARTYRGFLFLIISKMPIPEKEIRKLVNRGAETGRVIFNEMAIFPIEESTKEGRKLQEIIFNKTGDGLCEP